MASRNSYIKKWDKHWKEQTYDAWWLPKINPTIRHNIDSEKEDIPSLRYCEECDSVYDRIWTNNHYKVYIWNDFPKTQKKRTCPPCKGSKECKVIIGGNI